MTEGIELTLRLASAIFILLYLHKEHKRVSAIERRFTMRRRLGL